MDITQQAFADAVINYVEKDSDHQLNLTREESQAPDLWTYRTEGPAMSGSLCLVHHGMFDQVYERALIVPNAWSQFREQFYSPEARLLMHFYRECQQPSLLTWDPADNSRDDSPMTGHLWTATHQKRTYAALRKHLQIRGMVTQPTRAYADDADAFGVKLSSGVVDFPGSYWVLRNALGELKANLKFEGDFPRDFQLYTDSTPVLHMIGNTLETVGSELDRLIASKTSPTPKPQYVVYVFSELRDKQFIARNIGRIRVSVLEIAHGSVAGTIHESRDYLVPNDLSADEQRSFDCSSTNWGYHQARILEQCPVIAEVLASNNH
jgi:hypothetical protein